MDMEDAFPPIPATALALAERWMERDLLYEENVRLPLPQTTLALVRTIRQREAMALRHFKDRSKMWRIAQRWAQPKHKDFGGLEDYLE